MWIVREAPSVGPHALVDHRFVLWATASDEKRIRLSVQMAQTHVMESCGPVLLVVGVGRDQKERAVVETVAFVPDTCLLRVHPWGSEIHLLGLALGRRVSRCLLACVEAEGAVLGQRHAVRGCQLELVVPFRFKVGIVQTSCRLLFEHQLVDSRGRACFEVGLV